VSDSQYQTLHYRLSEREHAYGHRAHVLGDPFALTQLARLCAPETRQPEFNRLIVQLYTHLAIAACNHALPRAQQSSQTRMAAYTDRAVLSGERLDPDAEVVCVNVARAGTLPSQTVYDLLNTVLVPERVRQDHLIVSRVATDGGHVTGAEISASKIGGPIAGRTVIIPDPMGATGTSLSTVIDHLTSHYGTPARILLLHLIVTPQYLRHVLPRHPLAEVMALRLDRGMSSADVLATPFGQRWDEENGLTPNDYIVPGGGGFGELMNNAFV
jgi:uracil phosphoribosyltransferase